MSYFIIGGTNVAVGQKSGGRNVGGRNVCGTYVCRTKVAPPLDRSTGQATCVRFILVFNPFGVLLY